METNIQPNNNQDPVNETLNYPKVPNHRRFFSGFYGVLVLVAIAALVFFGMMYWSKRDLGTQKKPENETVAKTPQTRVLSPEELDRETKLVLGASNEIFPKVEGLGSASSDSLPTDAKALIIEGATKQIFNTVKYKDGQSGFYISYEITFSTIEKVQETLKQNLVSNSGDFTWTMSNNSRTDMFGFQDYNAYKTKDKARVTFFQQKENVKVAIQIVNAPIEK
jgi:hypothetical protein